MSDICSKCIRLEKTVIGCSELNEPGIVFGELLREIEQNIREDASLMQSEHSFIIRGRRSSLSRNCRCKSLPTYSSLKKKRRSMLVLVNNEQVRLFLFYVVFPSVQFCFIWQ